MGQGAGNLDQLPLGLAKVLDPRRRIDPRADQREARFGPRQHRSPINVSEPSRDGVREHWWGIDQDILCDAQRWQKR